MVCGVDDCDRRVGGGEGVEHSSVTRASESGSQSSNGSSVGRDATMAVSDGFSRMKKR